MLGFTVTAGQGRHELRCGAFKINVHSSGKELVPHSANIVPGSTDFCLEVDDELEDILKTVREKGFVIEMEKTIKNGFYGKMASIYLRDPDGNLVELCMYGEKE